MQLAPAWSSDRISAAGRRKLADAGIVPPGPAPQRRLPGSPIPITLRPVATALPCPRVRIHRHRGDGAFRRHGVQVVAPLPDVRRAVRALQGALTPCRRPARSIQLTVADVAPLCGDAVAITFDVPAELADEFAFRPGQWVTVRRMVDGAGAAPLVLDLRPGRSAAADRRSGGTRRGGVDVAGPQTFGRATASRCSRPSGTFTPDVDAGGPPRADRRRLGHHAGAVDRRRPCSPTRRAASRCSTATGARTR